MDNSEIDDASGAGELNESHVDGETVQNSREEADGALSAGDEEQREKLLRLPLGRIKNIIKMDPDVNLVNQEAVFLTAKSVVNELT